MDLARFRRVSKANKPRLYAFLARLDEIVPEGFPALITEKDKEVWSEIDCTQCANCCKTMTPTYTTPDIRRIATHLHLKPKDLIAKWLMKNDAGEYVNQTQPCQWLRPDNLCGIYEVRPADCAEFPHHNKQPFDAYNETFQNNLVYCPATYELVSKLEKSVKDGWEW